MVAALPDFVVIGGVGYQVQVVDDLRIDDADGSSRDLVGHIEYHKCRIRIDSGAQEQAKVICLFHEIGHALLYHAGLDSGEEDPLFEKTAQMLGYSIYALLRNNPGLERLAGMAEMMPSPPAPLPQGEGS